MPKHNTYEQDENISENDIVLGSDAEDNLKTKNFRIGKLKDYFLSFVETIVGPQGPQGEVGPQGPPGQSASVNYKVYTALLTQSGTNDPVATVLENTLGYDIVWSRLNAGGYIARATEFAIEDVNKFYCNIGNKLLSVASTDIVSYIVEASNLPVGSPSSFEVYTKTILNSTGVVTRGDNILEFTPIEIRVYN